MYVLFECCVLVLHMSILCFFSYNAFLGNFIATDLEITTMISYHYVYVACIGLPMSCC